MPTITGRGVPMNVAGTLPAPGESAPPFRLTNGQLADVTLADYAGRNKVLNILPSLDTPTCATTTRRFNELAAGLGNTVVLVVSADLPFAQKRFCEVEGITGVEPLAMLRDKAFAQDYGVLLVDGPLAGLAARAVVVIDAQDRVIHSELVPEIAQEPDYEAVLAALPQHGGSH